MEWQWEEELSCLHVFSVKFGKTKLERFVVQEVSSPYGRCPVLLFQKVGHDLCQSMLSDGLPCVARVD